MKSFIFDLITSPLSLFENPIYNYIVMSIIGLVAFVIAYRTVGEMGLRGEAGSRVHWIIRLFITFFLWLVGCIIIKTITFITDNILVSIICIFLLLFVWLLKKYANKHSKCFLNKKIFDKKGGDINGREQ